MKILAIHSVGWFKDDCTKESGVDIWRIWRPLEELKKHTDWQIDYQPSFIPGIEKYKDLSEFTEEEMEIAAKKLGKYDIVFSSYHPDPASAALMDAVHDLYGTKFVLDIDDDMFAINDHNPFWTKVDEWGVYVMQRTINTTKYITTTNEYLAKKIQDRTEVDGKVFVLPNYIPDTYKHPAVDNGDKIVIGYFGGSSHYVDLHETKLFPALQRIMHKYKNVHFKCVGQPVDYYLPSKRKSTHEPIRGRDWVTKLFPTLNMDIVVIPLEDVEFSKSKSNIKWQEATRAGAAVVASDVQPYQGLKHCATLVKDTENDWYTAIEQLLDSKIRSKQVEAAKKELAKWRLEDHWQEYKKAFEEIYAL